MGRYYAHSTHSSSSSSGHCHVTNDKSTNQARIIRRRRRRHTTLDYRSINGCSFLMQDLFFAFRLVVPGTPRKQTRPETLTYTHTRMCTQKKKKKKKMLAHMLVVVVLMFFNRQPRTPRHVHHVPFLLPDLLGAVQADIGPNISQT